MSESIALDHLHADAERYKVEIERMFAEIDRSLIRMERSEAKFDRLAADVNERLKELQTI